MGDRRTRGGLSFSMKYAHTNLIARDWRALADFYVAQFGCEVVPPERDYAGAARVPQ